MKTTKKTELPPQYRETKMLQCDACGTEAPFDVVVNGPYGDQSIVLGWFRGGVSMEDGLGSIGMTDAVDVCPKCYPAFHKVVKQELDSARAYNIEAVAEAVGIT